MSCQSTILLVDEKSYLRDQILDSKADKNILFGINGHVMHENYIGHSCQYNQFSIEEQVRFLKQLNLKIYRNDIHVDENGFWNGESPEKFEKLLSELKKNEIELLPMIFTNPWRTGEVRLGKNWDYYRLEKELNSHYQLESYVKSLDVWTIYYDLAFLTGKNFATKYGDRINYYNIGNEIAYRILKYYPHPKNPIQNPTPYESELFFLENFLGEDMEDFFTIEEHAKRTVASAAYVSGMIDGIKSVDEHAKCVVNDGKVNFGYFKFLEILNVNYDIIGWNWYDSNFSVPNWNYDGLNAYEQISTLSNNKPIWITETNNFAGSLNYQKDQSKSNAESLQAKTLKDRLEVFYHLPNIQAILVYELIDQEPKEETYWENAYGLLSAPFPTKEYAQPKPAFDTYRFTIEELQYGNEDFAIAVIQDLFRQEMIDSVSEKTYMEWVNSTDKESTLKKLILSSDLMDIEFPEGKISKEQINEMTTAQFQRFLKRTPLKRELRFWQRQLKRNPDLTQMTLEIMLSEEYWENAVWAGYEKRTGFMRPQLPR